MATLWTGTILGYRPGIEDLILDWVVIVTTVGTFIRTMVIHQKVKQLDKKVNGEASKLGSSDDVDSNGSRNLHAIS